MSCLGYERPLNLKKKGVGSARRLRREATDAETILWLKLRDRRLGGFKFRRQEPRAGYIADFVCIDRKLIVEVDGGQHAGQALADEIRTVRLGTEGYRVLRFWNNDVGSNIEGVLDTILTALGEDPSPHPSPRRGEGVSSLAFGVSSPRRKER